MFPLPGAYSGEEKGGGRMKKRWAAFLTAAVLAAVLFPARSWAVELPVEAQAALLISKAKADAEALKSSAQAEADKILADAKFQASLLLEQAKGSAEKLAAPVQPSSDGFSLRQLEAIDKINKQLDELNVTHATQVFRLKQALMTMATEK